MKGIRVPRLRSTVRLRLTLLYGGLFFIAGALLLILTYTLIGRAQPPPDESQFLVLGPRPSEATVEERVQLAQTLFEERQRARDAWLRSIRTQSASALVVTSIGALALGWIVAGRVLDPIRQITSHAQRLSSATLGDRIALQGPRDELRELADTMDAMLDRLQAAFDSQRNFSAQVSHELRTPLAIIRAEADVALASPSRTLEETELARKIQTAVERCEGLIDGLLTLARSDSTMHDRVQVDLAELTGDVVGEHLQAATDAQISVDLQLENARVAGDRALLERLVANLFDNAIRYNQPGGWVHVALDERDALTYLRIENSGPVIPQDETANLLTPFQRGQRRSFTDGSGYGLGLAIVQAVTIAHGGSVAIQAREQGGLEVVVTMPSAPGNAIA